MRKNFLLQVVTALCALFVSVNSRAVPVFSTNPSSQTVCYTVGSVTFNAGASDGSHILTYYWQVSTNGGTIWANVSGTVYSGDTTNSLTVTVTNTTLNGYKYRCIASDSTGLDTSAVATLVVDSLPSAGTVSGPTSFCAGSTGMYTETVSGGAWVSSNPMVAVISGSGVLTGVMGGQDTVGYTVTNICGSAIAKSATITIDSMPAFGAITGLDSVCKGSAISMTETVVGGAWSTSSMSIGTIGTTGVFTAVAQGFDTVKYTVLSGLGCAGVATKVVRVDTNAVAMPLSGPTVTCVGREVLLTDANIYGIPAWSASNAHASVSGTGTVTGASYGIDTITYNFTNACNSVSTTLAVTVDTPINPGVVSGPTGVCVGSWIHLTNSVPGGFWISGNSSIATADGSGDVTGVAEGSVTISCLFENGCGSTASVYTITVYGTAAAITAMRHGVDAGDSVGVDSTLTLADATPSGSWSSSDTTVAKVNAVTGVTTGIAPGTATISYSVTNLCGTSDATYVINVGLPPFPGSLSASGGNDTVCQGHTLALTSTVPGGVWSSGNDTFATVNAVTGVVTAIAASVTTISYTVTDAFGSSTTSMPVFIRSKPVIQAYVPSISSIGGAGYTLVATPEGGVWSSSNNAIGFITLPANNTSSNVSVNGVTYYGATFGNVVFLQGGRDTLYYTISNECGTSDSMFIIDLATTNGVGQVNGGRDLMVVYPNPNSGAFTFNVMSPMNEDAHVVITNMVGQVVKELNVTTNALNEMVIDQPSGVYFIGATTATGKFSTKFTITR